MLRTLWFLSMVVFISVSFSWLAGTPSYVSLDWRGYRVNTTIPILVGVLCGFSLLLA